jgi:hypothetical protein
MLTLTWLSIIFCLSQSAMFSGLNLALFGVTRLRLEVEVASGSKAAAKVLKLRKNSNFLLTTILWGNVGINVLLTLLSDSILAGVSAFVFSTVVITLVGEIMPQAYFSRNALRMASLLAPVLKFYQIVLYPVAKPSAMVLDLWLGSESIQYFRERDLKEVIRRHIVADEAEIAKFEGLGAMNFLAIDDLLVTRIGEPVDPKSIIELPVSSGKPVFPKIDRKKEDSFLGKVHSSGRKWVILTDSDGHPQLIMDADGFLRDALLQDSSLDPLVYCHLPIVVCDVNTPLESVISQWTVHAEGPGDDRIDQDIVLVWTDEKRIITGADILGRLLRGIAAKKIKA